MEKVKTGFLSLLAVGCFAISSLIPESAQAISAFTRTHKTECATCHTIFPELNEQGVNFMKNSFVWLPTKGSVDSEATKKNENAPPKVEGKDYLLLSGLPEYAPFSLRAVLDGSYNDKASAGNKF